jgi:hypothetical protein
MANALAVRIWREVPFAHLDEKSASRIHARPGLLLADGYWEGIRKQVHNPEIMDRAESSGPPL